VDTNTNKPLQNFNFEARKPSGSLDLKSLRAPKFLTYVAHGKQDLAEKMLLHDATLLLKTGAVTDYSNRTLTHVTAYEYAYWAGDWHMCRMLERHMSDEIKATLLQRIEAIESKGLTYRQDGSIVENSRAFDFTPLKTALRQYVEEFHHATREQSYAAWLNICAEQRKVPIYFVSECCTKHEPKRRLGNFGEEYLPREIRPYDFRKWFPLESRDACAMGGFSYSYKCKYILKNLQKDLAFVCHFDDVKTHKRMQSFSNLRSIISKDISGLVIHPLKINGVNASTYQNDYIYNIKLPCSIERDSSAFHEIMKGIEVYILADARSYPYKPTDDGAITSITKEQLENYDDKLKQRVLTNEISDFRAPKKSMECSTQTGIINEKSIANATRVAPNLDLVESELRCGSVTHEIVINYLSVEIVYPEEHHKRFTSNYTYNVELPSSIEVDSPAYICITNSIKEKIELRETIKCTWPGADCGNWLEDWFDYVPIDEVDVKLLVQQAIKDYENGLEQKLRCYQTGFFKAPKKLEECSTQTDNLANDSTNTCRWGKGNTCSIM